MCSSTESSWPATGPALVRISTDLVKSYWVPSLPLVPSLIPSPGVFLGVGLLVMYRGSDGRSLMKKVR